MDSHILSVWGMRDLTEASSADSMGGILDVRYSSRLNGWVAATLSGVDLLLLLLGIVVLCWIVVVNASTEDCWSDERASRAATLR